MEETMELNISEVFAVLLRKWWMLVVSTVMLASLALGYTALFVTPQYQASVYMYVNNKSNNTSGNNAISSSELAVALQLVTTYVTIIKRDAVLETAAEHIAERTGVNYTASQLRGMLSASSVDETEVFQVLVSNPDPEMAATVANAIAEVAPAVIASTIEGSSAKVIDFAKVPTKYYSPNYAKNAIIGGVIGFALAAAMLVLQVLLDKRIKSQEDVEKLTKAPILGMIPDFMSEQRSGYYRYEADSRKKEAK